MEHRLQQGLTLIELMVTLAIAAVMLAIGVPAMNNMVTSNQITAELNQLNGLLRQARYAALEQRMQVIVCPTDDFINCSTSNDWNLPKMAYVERGGAATIFEEGEGDVFLASLPQTGKGLALKSKPTDTSVVIWTFQPAPRTSTDGQFVICPSNSTKPSGLAVSPLGRLSSVDSPTC